jgi:hypothetical protein
MLKKYYSKTFLLIGFIVFLFTFSFCQDKKPFPSGSFYSKSLHYTAKGIISSYAKENNGLEKLTGKNAVEIGCDKPECHVKECDVCHTDTLSGRPVYSVDRAKSEVSCKFCHGDNKESQDTHFARGMKCMDCHSSREIHGDGKEYSSYNEPGAMDTKCENCHTSVGKSKSHDIHKDKVDCAVCHTSEFTTCYNCHIDSWLKNKKNSSLKVKDMFFMVNHNGKIKLANFLSYVYGNKTMITLAPTFNHSITSKGRKCAECHNNQIIKDINNNKFKPFKWENDKLVNTPGFVPVFEGMKWDIDYLSNDNGKWALIKDPAPPIITFSGYCSPLTKEQFRKLGGK